MWLSMESKDTMPLETWYPPLARRPDMMHTYLVSVSMVWTCTLLWVWERTASCWAHFKQRPPTRLEAPAARRDSLCFNLSLRSSQVFWYSTKSFLKGRGKILGNVQGKVQCFQMKHQRELPPPSVVWTHGLAYPSLEHRGTAPLLYYVENAIREHYSGNTGSSPNIRFYLKPILLLHLQMDNVTLPQKCQLRLQKVALCLICEFQPLLWMGQESTLWQCLFS